MASRKLIFSAIFLLISTVSAATTCKTRIDCINFPCKNGDPICSEGSCFCRHHQQQQIDAAAAYETQNKKFQCKVKDDCKNHRICPACACIDGVCFSSC